MVTRSPSTFGVAVKPAMTTPRSPSGICMGMQIPVVAAGRQGTRETDRRLDVSDRVSDDREQPRGPAERLEHGPRVSSGPSWHLVGPCRSRDRPRGLPVLRSTNCMSLSHDVRRAGGLICEFMAWHLPVFTPPG